MKEFFVVTSIGIAAIWLAAAGVPWLLLVVVLGGGFMWLLASAADTQPSTPKQKSPPSGCPFLDMLP